MSHIFMNDSFEEKSVSEADENKPIEDAETHIRQQESPPQNPINESGFVPGSESIGGVSGTGKGTGSEKLLGKQSLISDSGNTIEIFGLELSPFGLIAFVGIGLLIFNKKK